MAEFVNEKALAFMRRTAAAEDGVLTSLHGQYVKQELPMITPEAGRFLQVLLLAMDARRVLEVGTCLGYSAIWMARGLPDSGLLETIEVDKERAAQAQEWFTKAGVAGRVRLLEGKASGVLPTLPTKSYDAVFLDADKEGLPSYLKFAVKLLRHGGVLLADNVFWHGTAFSPTTNIEGSEEVRAFVKAATEHPELEASILPLGDGLLVAYRK